MFIFLFLKIIKIDDILIILYNVCSDNSPHFNLPRKSHMTAIFITIGLILLIIGILGIIYPALPGLPLMFVGALSIAYAHEFTYMAWWSLGAVLLIAIIGSILDYVAGTLGAKFTGASKQALLGSLLGAFVGGVLSLFGMWPAIFLGPLVGAAVGEYIAKQDLLKAGKVGIGTFIGFIAGVIAKIGCALMIVLIVSTAHFIPWIDHLFQ